MKTTYPITSQAAVRASFWESFPHFAEQAREAGILSKRQNHHCATVRCTFVDYVDSLAKSGTISPGLASRVTL